MEPRHPLRINHAFVYYAPPPQVQENRGMIADQRMREILGDDRDELRELFWNVAAVANLARRYAQGDESPAACFRDMARICDGLLTDAEHLEAWREYPEISAEQVAKHAPAIGEAAAILRAMVIAAARPLLRRHVDEKGYFFQSVPDAECTFGEIRARQVWPENGRGRPF